MSYSIQTFGYRIETPPIQGLFPSTPMQIWAFGGHSNYCSHCCVMWIINMYVYIVEMYRLYYHYKLLFLSWYSWSICTKINFFIIILLIVGFPCDCVLHIKSHLLPLSPFFPHTSQLPMNDIIITYLMIPHVGGGYLYLCMCLYSWFAPLALLGVLVAHTN